MATTFSLEDFERSDAYHNSFLIAPDEALAHTVKACAENDLPTIAVSAAQGKLLNLLARTIGAKRILEVGTLGGYSAIWLAHALHEDGELITLELYEKNAEVARANLAHAGLSSKATVIVGPAAETIKTLQPAPPFDFIFIDADKPNNVTYFIEAKRLVRKGGIIIVDNVVRKGDVAKPIKTDMLEGVRALLEHIKTDKEVDATTIGTAGEKGYDGFLYALRL